MNSQTDKRFAYDEHWQPPVSVVVPVYNRAEQIRRCIESLLASRYPADRLEIIVVDNASTDETPGVLAGFGSRITVVHEATPGVSAARNAGLRAASAEVLAYTDSDCRVDPMWLRRLVVPLQDMWVGAVGGRIRAERDGNEIARFGELIHDHNKAINALRPPYLITMNTAFRTDVLRSLSGFNEDLLRCEDVDLALRLVAAGFTLTYVDDAVIYHDNRDTLWTLAREGYQHGYYACAVRRLHAEFVSEMFSGGPRVVPLPSAGGVKLSPSLSPGREAMYWTLFRTAKALGTLAGYLPAWERFRHV